MKVGKLSFKLDNLVGRCFGTRFDVNGKDLVPTASSYDPQAHMEEGWFQVPYNKSYSSASAVEDNRNLVQARTKQALSNAEVLSLQQPGLRGDVTTPRASAHNKAC